MKLYFVVEENISSGDMKGTKFLCKSGVRYDYGDFREKTGLVSEHKAQLEIEAARKYWKTSQHKTLSDVWEHYVEIHDIE